MILITTKVHDYLLETLSQKGLEYAYLPTIQYQELYDKIDQATGLIVATHISIDKYLIDKAIQLKWIGRLGSGMEHIDVAYAQQKNILCVSSPEGNCVAVAEHALGLLLSLMRNIHKSANEVKNHAWLREQNRGFELSGKTIGIIGYGNTGKAFANLLTSFGVTILAHDKYKKDFGNQYVTEATLSQIMQNADVVSFHLPLTEETIHYANQDFFNRLKKNPYIINTSRGQVIDTNSLITSLKNNQINGIALDVLENENITLLSEQQKASFDFLLSQSNVIITAHIAGYSKEAAFKMCKVLLEKLNIS